MAVEGDVKTYLYDGPSDGCIKNVWKCMHPIADIRGADTLNYRKGEKILRCKLAACARLVDCFGWSSDANVFASARIDRSDHLLCLPSFLKCHEVTAGSLVKLDFCGNVIDSGSSDLGVNMNEALFQCSIFSKREDLNVLLFISSPSTISISILKCGLLPLCQEAMLIGEIGYMDFVGKDFGQLDSDMLFNLFPTNGKVLLVKNYGVLIAGDSVEDLFFTAICTMEAIETQLNLLPFGLDNLYIASDEVQEYVKKSLDNPPTGDQMKDDWKIDQVHFQALARLLDNAGFSTGYVNENIAASRAVRSHSTTDIAPNLSLNEGRRSALDRTLTPVSFHRVESAGPYSQKQGPARWIVETGLLNKPRSSSVRVSNTNKFAPQGSNPRELKQKVKEIRKEYYEDTITSGPQSSVLEGVTWEEAKKIKACTGMGDGFRVAAASRGIIQRSHQKEALFYKNYTLSNPFENISDIDLEKYKEEVEKKTKQYSLSK